MAGATFSEVLVAIALTSVGLVATMGALQAAYQQFGRGVLATRAMEMADSKLEAKRAVRWDQLLTEDFDQNGLPESLMHDDGTAGDRVAGDGIYSASYEQNGVTLNWTAGYSSAPDSSPQRKPRLGWVEQSAQQMSTSSEALRGRA
jgi:hypothetical protein